MKLLYCLNCLDIVKLMRVPRFCRCSQTFGCYLENDVDIDYRGNCVVLGINNSSLEQAIKSQEKDRSFQAYVINPATHVKHVG